MKKDATYHVISNTHWDREWRFPFQRNRQMLVDMIDEVLDILESNPDYRAFHLDSQSIVLKDYLEVRPHKKDLIIRLTKENRLLHGPWYILPEEFQVGGENLVRNLLIGHKVSKEYGGVSKIGYSPFSWGQISQLPQIYEQFGIELIMFYRGVNSEDSPKSEFMWEGADGTRKVTSRFSTMPRYNFYFYIYRPAVHNQGLFQVEHKWNTPATKLFHFADKEMVDEDYFITSKHSRYYPETLKDSVEALTSNQDDDFTTEHKIWMEGHDSSGPNTQTTQIIKDIKEQMPELNVKHSTLEEYASDIANSVNEEALKLVKGERRSAQNNDRCGNLFGYTTSARMYLKQENFEAERWAQYYAEPFNVFSGIQGRDINDQYPDLIWELIVQNSAHDSIGGCSLDPIHQDMMMRYKSAIEMSKGVFERANKHLVGQLNTSGFPSAEGIAQGDQIFLMTINPTNYSREDVVEAFIDVPTELDQGGIELYNKAGEALEIEIKAIHKGHQPVLEQMINRPMHLEMIQYQVLIQIKDLKSYALEALHVKPVAPSTVSMDTSEESLELSNAQIAIEINQDGSLNITDKVLGKTYSNTAYFEDHGDGGHAWVCEPMGETVSTLGTAAKIVKTVSGELYNEFKITHELSLAPNADLRRAKDNSQNTISTVEMTLGLYANSPVIHLNIEVDNQAESHRLRLMCPTFLKEAMSYGEGQFDVPARETVRRTDTADWKEQPMYDYPMHHFVDVANEQSGFAALVDGLKEYEVLEDENKTLAITLLRTFEFKINPAAPQDYTHHKDGQMLGKSSYRLGLYSHAGTYETSEVFKQAMLFNYSARCIQTSSQEGTEGSVLQLMEVVNTAVQVSTVKKPEQFEAGNSFVLRVFNPNTKTEETLIRLPKEISSVEELNLEEITLGTIETQGNEFTTRLGAKAVKTFKITL